MSPPVDQLRSFTTDDDGSRREGYLDLELLASEPYGRFVYGEPDEARAVHRLLLTRGIGEFSPPQAHVTVVEDDHAIVAAVACVPGKELATARLQAAVALAKADDVTDPPDRRERRRLAATTLLTPEPDDLYVSRLAVAEPARGRGLARQLLTVAESEARRLACGRLALDVSTEHERARRLYRQAGFEEIGGRRVRDPATGRQLCHLHLAKPLG